MTIVSTRKSFVEKVSDREQNTSQEAKFDKAGSAVQILGPWTQARIQRQAIDAATLLANKFYNVGKLCFYRILEWAF